MGKNNGAGKGDKTRPYNKQKYDENFDRIFSGKKKVLERHAEESDELGDANNIQSK